MLKSKKGGAAAEAEPAESSRRAKPLQDRDDKGRPMRKPALVLVQLLPLLPGRAI